MLDFDDVFCCNGIPLQMAFVLLKYVKQLYSLLATIETELI